MAQAIALPIEATRSERKKGHIAQAGAICRRRVDGEVKILLIGSRRNGRWGIPKGTVEAGETSPVAAAREAFEEAGIQGICHDAELGVFRYSKEGKPSPFEVRVHLLDVAVALEDFPEKGWRDMSWVSISEAIDLVWHPQLKRILTTVA